MSNSPVFDKLNLHPKSSKYIFAKEDGGVGNIFSLNYSNLIHEQFTGTNTAAFSNRVDGIFPFSSQKYQCIRVQTNATPSLSIFAKVPIIAEGTTSTKPYRSAFKGHMFISNTSTSADSIIIEFRGRFPSTLEADNSVTIPLELDIQNPTLFAYDIITPNTDTSTFNFLALPFSPFFYVGRDPSSVGYVDSAVDTTSNKFLYIGGLMQTVGAAQTRTIKTLFEYI
jgi:hypothetical protein